MKGIKSNMDVNSIEIDVDGKEVTINKGYLITFIIDYWENNIHSYKYHTAPVESIRHDKNGLHATVFKVTIAEEGYLIPISDIKRVFNDKGTYDIELNIDTVKNSCNIPNYTKTLFGVLPEQICIMCHLSSECSGCCKICEKKCNAHQVCGFEMNGDHKERLKSWLSIVNDNENFSHLRKYIRKQSKTSVPAVGKNTQVKSKRTVSAKGKNYPGHKRIEGVYQKIINNIPYCKKYIELFCGSGAIAEMIKKNAPGTTVLCNDINKGVAGRIKFENDGVTAVDAIRYLQSKALDLNCKDDFIFLDPPYHPDTRPNTLKLYEDEMTPEDHKQLILSVLQIKCPVMIIHPDHHLYNTLLENGWRSIQLKIRYHNKTSIENLYMNYPVPEKLLITKFIGDDCWDRQRIKRKGNRTVNKIKNLPPAEKQYILERIKEELL